jgi:predicted dehydrogenase
VIRIVQVGMGAWGRDWASRVFPAVSSAQLAGCVDSRAAALAGTRKLGVVDAEHCFTSLDDALGAVAASAVLVTTDLPSHIPMVKAALRAGKHVLVEKPFAPSVAEAKDAVELADTLGLTLMVSQNYRFFPAVRAVQQVTREEQLGKLLHIDLDFRRHSPPSTKRLAGHRNWDQPLLLDMSIHHFDLLRAVTGREATAVYCRTHNPAWTGFREPPEGAATIDLGDDLSVNYRGSWTHPGRKTLWAGEWRMEFEKGELWWTSRGDLQTDSQDEAWIYDHYAKRSAVTLPDLARTDRAGALDAFATAIAEGAQPESSGKENLGSLALAHAAVESSLKRETVAVATLGLSYEPSASPSCPFSVR